MKKLEQNLITKKLFASGLFPLALFILLHAARPFYMGLYHDDWYLFTMPHRMPYSEIFPSLYSGFLDRPIFNIVLYGAIISWDGRPETLTMVASIFVGITSLVLYAFLKKLCEIRHQNPLGASVGTAFWIAIPWGFGYSLWPIGTMTLLGTIFFLIAAIFVIKFFISGHRNHLLFYSVGLLLSFFSYQSNYFAFIPLIALVAVLLPRSKIILRRSFYLLAIGFSTQIVSIIYTKFVSIKTLSINLKFIFGNFFYALPVAIADSFGPYWWGFLLIALVVCLGLIWGGLKLDRSNQADLLKAFLICCIGIAIGTLPYSLAGYMLKGLGVFSRTTITTNLWLAVMVCIVIIYASKMRYEFTKIILIGLFMSIALCTLASLNQSIGWALSWKRQNEILKNFPKDELLNMPSNSLIILNEPIKVRDVEVFGASWDITNAVYERLRPLMPKQEIPPKIFPIRENMTWDGVNTLKIGPNETIKAKKLWIYTPTNQDLKEVFTAGSLINY